MHVHDWAPYYLLARVELNMLSYACNKLKFKAKILGVSNCCLSRIFATEGDF